MSRYIDAEPIIKYIYRPYSNEESYSNTEIEKMLDSAPAVDLVRCGECIHNGSFDTDCPFGWKNGEWNMPRPCDFCSYGEGEKE